LTHTVYCLSTRYCRCN